jgi:hypothetical protein
MYIVQTVDAQGVASEPMGPFYEEEEASAVFYALPMPDPRSGTCIELWSIQYDYTDQDGGWQKDDMVESRP